MDTPEHTPVVEDQNASAAELQQRAADDYAGEQPAQQDN